jgi:hypothetical protein
MLKFDINQTVLVAVKPIINLVVTLNMKTMKHIIFIIIPAFILVGSFSCKKGNGIKPGNSNTSKLDTSTTLISNTELVGNWNLVTDTVSIEYGGRLAMYHGIPSDHYVFTKYANLYVNSGLNAFIDTGIYTISNSNQLGWESLYGGVLGHYGKDEGAYIGGYVVTSVTAHSLVLTSNTVNSLAGNRYEQIILKK